MISAEARRCECGCGQPAPIATKNSKLNGYVKGLPMRFVLGHWPRGENSKRWKGGKTISSDGYERIRVPTHPKACNGYVLGHRLIAEKAIGKILPDKSPIHHHDKTQLVVCESDGYHKLLHKRTRALKSCGHANWERCKYCKQYDDPLNLKIIYTGVGSSFAYHSVCNNQYKKLFYHASIKRNIK